MQFKEIQFSDKNAQRIYINYINRVRNSIKSLNKENQNETLLEINSHIYEAISNASGNELENILDVTERLGNPEVFLKELVAEKSIDEATKSFNPFKILKALLLNITNGISYVVFFILYLLLFAFLYLIVAKIVEPENVGLFIKAPDFFILGRTNHSLQYEKLGNWFIPVMIICTVVLYFIITLLLRLKRKFKNK